MISGLMQNRMEELNVLAMVSDNIISTIEYASRICYNSVDKIVEGQWYNYIKARIRSGHESVIEHGMISMVVYGLSSDSSLRDISEVNRILCESNSMLHYTNDTKDFLFEDNVFIFSISGNIKMWRDFFKYIDKIHENTVLLKMMAYMFRKINFPIGDLFSFDIPYIFRGTDALTSNYIFYNGYKENNLVGTPMVLKKEDNVVIDRRTKVDTGDDGLKLHILNVDNPSRSISFNKELYDIIPLEVFEYIRKHIKDLSSITFEVTIPRIITQQECRHRINSISQSSQRYINEGDNPNAHTFYEPQLIDCNKEYVMKVGDKEIALSYNEFTELSRKLYIELMNDKIPRETARFVLPNAIYSTMVITKPFYTLDHYFKERTSERAQYEIRLPAVALKKYLNEHIQNYLSNYNQSELFL